MTTLNLSLSSSAEAILREIAAAQGQPLDEYATAVLEQAAALTVDELMTPVRRQVAESGMSDDDFAAFIKDIRDRVHQDRQGRRP